MDKRPKNYDWVVIWGHTFHKAELVKLACIFGFFFLVALGVAGYLGNYYWQAHKEKLAQTEEEVEAAVEEKERRTQDPVRRFIENHFAVTRFNEVNSIRAVGTYTAGDVVLDFTLQGKQPRFYKQTLKANGRKIEAGFDGKELWYRQNYPLLDQEDEGLQQLNRALAMLECSIPCIAWEYEEEGLVEEREQSTASFQLLPETQWNGRPCQVVKNLRMLDTPVYHYIDSETGLELYRRASVTIGERRQKDVELFFKEPMEGLDYPLPSGFELWVDGRLFCTVEFESVEVNRGLMNYLFQEPAAE